MNRLISDHIEQYINGRKKEGWTVIENAEKMLSTKNLSCVAAVYDMNPDTVRFGCLCAFYVYAEDTKEEACYKLDYCIRQKGNTCPILSNCPTNLRKIQVTKFHGMPFAETVDIDQTIEAFLMFTPTKSLKGFNRDLRESMLAIRHFVAGNKLCDKMHHLERKREKMAENAFKDFKKMNR